MRLFPDLKSDPETETSLQLLNSFKHEISSSSASEGILVCEPQQSIPLSHLSVILRVGR
jgi:hypothetical protein